MKITARTVRQTAHTQTNWIHKHFLLILQSVKKYISYIEKSKLSTKLHLFICVLFTYLFITFCFCHTFTASEIDITIYIINKNIEKKIFEVQSQDHIYIPKNNVRK